MRRRPEHQQVGNKIWKIKEVIQLRSCCAIIEQLGTITCDTAGIREDLSQKVEQPNSLDQGLLCLTRVLGEQLRGLSKRMLLYWSSSFWGDPFGFFSRFCILLPTLWMRLIIYSKKAFVQFPEQVWSLQVLFF